MIRIALAFLIFIAPATIFGEAFQERTDWGHFFADESVDGTIVVIDERSNSYWIYGQARAQTRYRP